MVFYDFLKKPTSIFSNPRVLIITIVKKKEQKEMEKSRFDRFSLIPIIFSIF